MAEPDKREVFSPFVGLAFIILGLIFLLRNFDVIRIGHRWWALFFLIPISYLLRDVISGRQYRRSLSGLLMLGSLMVIFLFGVSWSAVWPLFIIIGGLSLLLARG